MFEYTVKNDMEKCWDSSHIAKVKQVDAFIQYLSYLVLKPADILHTRFFIEAAYVSLMALPATVPIAVLTAPVFFVSRRVSVTKQNVNQFLDKRKQEKVKNIISEHDKQNQAQISPQTWQKAVQQATEKLFIQNKKRMIIVNELTKQKTEQSNDQKNSSSSY